MNLGRIILIASIFTSNIAFAGSKLTFCNSCNTSMQKNAAEKVLSGGGKLLIYDKSTQKMQKWGLTDNREADSGPSENLQEEEELLFAVKIRLTSSDLELKSSIDDIVQMEQTNDQLHTFIDFDHPFYGDATASLIDPLGYAEAVYHKLVEDVQWRRLQQNIEKFQNKKSSSSTVSVEISTFSGSFTRSPGSKNYYIHIKHHNGSTVKIAIDTSKDISASLHKAFIFVIAKDANGITLPGKKSSLTANGTKTYYGNASDIRALADLFSTFDDVTVEDICAPEETLECRMTGRVISRNNGNVSYVLVCSLGDKSICE